MTEVDLAAIKHRLENSYKGSYPLNARDDLRLMIQLVEHERKLDKNRAETIKFLSTRTAKLHAEVANLKNMAARVCEIAREVVRLKLKNVRVEGENTRLREMLKQCEFTYVDHEFRWTNQCPKCFRAPHRGHAPDCALDALLQDTNHGR